MNNRCVVCKKKEMNNHSTIPDIPLPIEFGKIEIFNIPIMYMKKNKKNYIYEISISNVALCHGCYNRMFLEGKYIISNKYIIDAMTEFEIQQQLKYFFKDDEI